MSIAAPRPSNPTTTPEALDLLRAAPRGAPL